MKCILSLALIFLSLALFAQEERFTGAWEGSLNVGINLKIGFHFLKDASGKWKATMDSPDQKVFGIPADSVSIMGNEVFTRLKKFQVSFSGKLVNDSSIEGIFSQGGSIPLQLKKVEKVTASKPLLRSQTPKAPFPYFSEDVIFSGKKTGLKYGATFTRPRIDSTVVNSHPTVFPTIVMITGSGPQDRDETILGHKPFAVIADYLARKGYAVLRVDDRGVAKTTGNFETATSLDFSFDTEEAIEYIKTRPDVDIRRIGLIGHSEGGMIAPMVATRRTDIKFLVMLAGPGIKNIDLLTEQNVAIYKSSGIKSEVADLYGPLFKKITLSIINAKDSTNARSDAAKILNEWRVADSVKKELKLYSEKEKQDYLNNLVHQLRNPWYTYFLNYDPAPVLKKISANVLALNGEKDIQVLAQSNMKGINKALQKSKSKSFDIKILPGLNHLFQQCNACTVAEYGQLDQTISASVLEIISTWLDKNSK
jgi:alpha/beta superfamily hydrolase